MTFNVLPQDEQTVIMLEYCTDLYRENTVRRMLNGYKRVLVQMLGDAELYENYADDEEEKDSVSNILNNTSELEFCLPHSMLLKYLSDIPASSASCN